MNIFLMSPEYESIIYVSCRLLVVSFHRDVLHVNDKNDPITKPFSPRYMLQHNWKYFAYRMSSSLLCYLFGFLCAILETYLDLNLSPTTNRAIAGWTLEKSTASNLTSITTNIRMLARIRMHIISQMGRIAETSRL